MDSSTTATMTEGSTTKRKRSPSSSTLTVSAPPAKSTKPSPTNQLSINYLVRQCPDDLPLINKDDTLQNLLQLVAAYTSVVDRHESLASNLGARPLAPILIKRFERCFDTSPRVVASHHKGAATSPDDATHSMTWLEVIEFARSHPSQFTLTTFSEGRRVCQFYYPQKQLRVQISEEDFLFISSGRCQDLIPPLPIWEDEEKEVGTCDVLEAKLKELTSAADMIAARTRQLSHRLKGRRAAILERRAEGGSGTPAKASALQTTTAPPSSSTGVGFTAVNTNGRTGGDGSEVTSNSWSVRNDLLRHFESLPHNQNQGRSQSRHHSISGPSEPLPQSSRSHEPIQQEHGSNASSLSPVPANAFTGEVSNQVDPAAGQRKTSANGQRRPSSTGAHAATAGATPNKHNFSRPLPPALESSQPFRPLCQAHMDSLARSQRVMPPCDRCRRLRMDCVKNLTSCLGCTKKHARCHWRDVSRDELCALDHLMDSAFSGPNGQTPTLLDEHGIGTVDTHAYMEDGEGHFRDSDGANEDEDDDSNPLEDLEALGGREESDTVHENQTGEDEERPRSAGQAAVQTRGEDLRPAALALQSDADIHEAAQMNGVSIHENEGLEHCDYARTRNEERPSDPVQSELPAEVDLPPTHTGFRAVNASQETLNGQPVALTAWRTG